MYIIERFLSAALFLITVCDQLISFILRNKEITSLARVLIPALSKNLIHSKKWLLMHQLQAQEVPAR